MHSLWLLLFWFILCLKGWHLDWSSDYVMYEYVCMLCGSACMCIMCVVCACVYLHLYDVDSPVQVSSDFLCLSIVQGSHRISMPT